ncbi:exo-alpha-sialidase [Testudinibacter sp. P80/BLE/0925]|uniref:exo-alpha-sialidase n=1 Tax=Testudinibacter sp. TW-1 TaxID=3417757 RepID=UPI003D36774C
MFAESNLITPSTTEKSVTASTTIPSIFTYSALTPFSSPINVTDTFTAQNAFQLESGSLTFRFKNSEATQLTALLGVSNSKKDNDYILFYVNRKASSDAFGIEIRKSTNLIPNNQLVTADIARNDNEFTTVTYTFDKTNKKIMIYVNGTLQKTYNGDTKFFKDIEGLDAAYVGRTKRASGTREMTFSGNVYYAGAESKVLTAEEVKAEHDKLTKNYVFEYNAYLEKEADNIKYASAKHSQLGSYMSAKEPLFQKGQGDANNYRIPALLTTNDGVVIAAIDKRHQHAADWGNIDTVIRRSLDGGKTWQDDQVIIDLVSQTYGSANAAFLIDPLMLQDKTSGRIFMLIDMFPETQGFFGINKDHSSEGTGYKKIKDSYYRILTGADGAQYTVRENGVVYNEDHQPTEYKVIVEGDATRGFKDLGDLYRGTERLGNVFLQTAQQGSDAAPLKVQITSYLWLTHSDDNGATWSSPVDLTPQVKADWMRFLGTGPGTGIQLKDGTLIMPVYYTNSNNKQSAALIISKDGGNTWERGESPNDRRLASSGGSRLLNDDWKQLTESQVVELDSGDLKLFSRNLNGRVQISTSKDGGYTWQKTIISDDILLDPYSQMSVIKYSKKINGKEYLVFANPHSASRSRINGMVWLGEVQEDGSIKWKYNATIATGNYGYNSLTELPDGSIGLLYEESAEKIQYVRLNLQEIVWSENRIYRDKRSTEHLDVSLTSDRAETFYKIGDGEMVKVGTGENAAKLVIEEGTATLKQTADDNGKVQAYAEVTVKQGATVRLGDNNQLPYDKLILEGGKVDLNGNTITVNKATSDAPTTGLYAETINGNFINSGEQTATLVYNAGGQHTINGNLGGVGENEQPNVNLIYNPDGENSTLAINGATVLNEIDVKTGKIIYKQNGIHFAENTKLGTTATLQLESGTTVVAKAVTLAQGATLAVNAEQGGLVSLSTETLSGAGTLTKSGKGLLQLSGNVNLTDGNIAINQGMLELDEATVNAKTFNLATGTTLSGNGNVTSAMTWQADSTIAPNHGFTAPENGGETALPFAAKTLSFSDIINQGASAVLRVNNISDDMTTWQHDFLKISGDLTNQSEQPIPVDVALLGTKYPNSDVNNNGWYDADEGISLIQIDGNTELGAFQLRNNNVLSGDLFNYTLVAFDKGVALASENKLGSGGRDFYDYRLQTRLIDMHGNPLSTLMRKPEIATDSAMLKEGELLYIPTPDSKKEITMDSAMIEPTETALEEFVMNSDIIEPIDAPIGGFVMDSDIIRLNDSLNDLDLKVNENLTLSKNITLNTVNVTQANLTYAGNEASTKQINLEKATLTLQGNTSVTIENTLSGDNGSNVVVKSEQNTALSAQTINLAGNITKNGEGLFSLSAENLKAESIVLNAGSLALAANMKEGKLILNGGTLFTTGEVNHLVLNDGATLSAEMPTENRRRTRRALTEFSALKVGSLEANGGSVHLRVNNVSENMRDWAHDQLLIRGDVSGTHTTAVNLSLLGSVNGQSDQNNNGAYDNHEGISLIQVGGNARLDAFKLADHNDLFHYTLVAFDKGAAAASENKVNDKHADFYDYRLQTRLINAQGDSPITTVTETAATATTVSETTATAVEAKTETPSVTATTAAAKSNYRAQINPLLPSHIVASDLILSHNNTVYQNFQRNSSPSLNNTLDNGQNMFVAYLNGKTEYKSSTAFADYGYNADSNYNGWILGGKLWQSEQQDRALYVAVNHGKYNIKPQAADGVSSGNYTTYGANMKFAQQFGDVYFALDGGYQHHKGNIQAGEDKSTLKANALRFGSEIGYHFNLGTLDLMPKLNVQFQRLNLKSDSKLFKLDHDTINAVTTNLGLSASWHIDSLTLGLDGYYQHNSNSKGDLLVRSAITEKTFTSGGLGNSLNLEAAAEYRIMPKLTLGVAVGYQRKLSDNAVNNRNLSANIKYMF